MKCFFASIIFISCGGFAHSETNSDFREFAKRCDLYRDEISTRVSYLGQLIAERRKLKEAKAPISLSTNDCGAVKHLVRLPNGNSTYLESSYPTNTEPDDKGMRYWFVPDYKSTRYWMFNGYGWEWQTWLLIDKRSGLRIETPTECGINNVSERGNWIISICKGSYANTSPTTYAALVSDKTRWTGGIEIGFCAEGRYFSGEIVWTGAKTFAVRGYCELGTDSILVNQHFSIDQRGLHSKTTDRKKMAADWQ